MADITFGTAGPADVDTLVDLCSRCLGIGAGHFAARLPRDPVFLPGGFLVARDGDRIVATVHAMGFELVFGSVRVPCGGIGNVSTDPAYRKRGLARRLLDDAHGLMRERGLPVSVLTTEIQDFYRPLGYEIWPHTEIHILKLRPPASAGPFPSVRRIDFARDQAALLAVREGYNRGLVGPIAGDTARWSRQPAWTTLYPKEDPALALAVEGEPGKPVAYIRGTADPERMWSKVVEFGAAPGADEAVRALGRAYLREAFARGVRGLQFPAPCRGLEAALAPYAEATVPVIADYLMLRVADLSGFLRALAPELKARLAAGRAAGGAVAIGYGDRSVVVRAGDGGVSVDTAPADPALPRAVLEPASWVEVFGGVKAFSAQPFARRSTVGEREIVLLDTLFPARDRVFWEIDAF